MSGPEQIDREIKEYLEKEPNLRREERQAFIRAIVNKNNELAKLEHVVNSADLQNIISVSKSNYTGQRVPVRISRRQVDPSEIGHIAVIEAFISYLNKMHLLKKQVKFDYTE